MGREFIRKIFGLGKCFLSFVLSFLLLSNFVFCEDIYTPNLGLRLPEVGVEDVVTPWGIKINNNFTILDSTVGGVVSGYFKLLGISGGQTAIGGTDAGDDLIFQTTSDASKGSYIFSELATGLVKSTLGTLSVVPDNHVSWDSAYLHSQVVAGNPHSVTKDEVNLGNVENTALSTWVGSSSINTLGTVTSGGLSIGTSLGQVNMSLGSDADGDIYYRSASKLTRLPKGTAGQALIMNPAATAPVWATTDSVFLRNYIDGFILENDAGDTEHDIKVNPGLCSSSDNDVYIDLVSALVKQIDVNWSAGTGMGGFPSGLTLTADTWYHFFVIIDNDTNTEDACFDSSLTAVNCLADASAYDDYRRVGSVLTDVSSNIIKFFQDGDKFIWDVPVADYSGTVHTTSVLRTLSVPTGSSFRALLYSGIYQTSTTAQGTIYGIITSPSQTDTVPSVSNFNIVAHAGSSELEKSVSFYDIQTNTSGQLRFKFDYTSGGAVNYKVSTVGWIDNRGKE